MFQVAVTLTVQFMGACQLTLTNIEVLFLVIPLNPDVGIVYSLHNNKIVHSSYHVTWN